MFGSWPLPAWHFQQEMSWKFTNYLYSELIVYKIYFESFKEIHVLHKHPALTEVFDTSESYWKGIWFLSGHRAIRVPIYATLLILNWSSLYECTHLVQWNNWGVRCGLAWGIRMCLQVLTSSFSQGEHWPHQTSWELGSWKYFCAITWEKTLIKWIQSKAAEKDLTPYFYMYLIPSLTAFLEKFCQRWK